MTNLRKRFSYYKLKYLAILEQIGLISLLKLRKSCSEIEISISRRMDHGFSKDVKSTYRVAVFIHGLDFEI